MGMFFELGKKMEKGCQNSHAQRRPALRGQFFSSELIVSSSVFIVAIVIFFLVWNSIYNSYTEEREDATMQVVLIGISDAAMLSPGDPPNWEISAKENASLYGFASSPNILSSAKLQAMQSYFAENYTAMKEKLGAGKYEVYIDVKDLDGNTYYSFGNFGNFEVKPISSVAVERLGMMDNKIVKMRIQIWRAKSLN